MGWGRDRGKTRKVGVGYPTWWGGTGSDSCSGKIPSRGEQGNLESNKALLSLPGLSGDPLEQLVRHFLIETGPKGVKIKGCPSEPYFGEKQELGKLPWVGLGRPRDLRKLARKLGTSECFSPFTIGSLSALVSQHSISPLSLPCCLRIPSKGGCFIISALISPCLLQPKVESRVLVPSLLFLGMAEATSPAPRECYSLLTCSVGPHFP